MNVLEAIHERRTVKKYEPIPVPREQLERILEAARWAPNHRMTQPWRFRVLGPVSLGRLATAAGEGAKKLMRAPTLVVASYVPSPIPIHAAEDEQATSCAIYATLLAAHAEGVSSYWRTINLLDTEAGRVATGVPANERVLGLLHFGTAIGELPDPPERGGIDEYVTFLD
ncbi:MAG: hypothetical protein JWM25_1127 [Thermoleophilia bacterium]|nr:hypothetical protein [Thermoleophilia bacterium]MCZ4496544.1 hypothetical protein [Thermoleophilia bacterium]